MGSVSSIGDDFCGLKNLDGSSNRSCEAIVFPALQQLRLKNMHSLVKWVEMEKSQSSRLGVKEFPHLEVLQISSCSKLTYLRYMRSLRSFRELSISCCSELVSLPMDLGTIESLEDISILGCANLVAFPGFHGLRSLCRLRIENCPKVTYLPQGLHNLKLLQYLGLVGLLELVAIPDLQSLQSLHLLIIEDCEKLSALPSGLEFCTSLNYVVIGRCSILLLKGLRSVCNLRKLSIGPFSSDLHYFPWFCTIPMVLTDENMDLKGPFASLQNLTLHGWPNLTSLPRELQFFSLTYLSIFEFNGLLALPEWLSQIQSLETIKIWYCDNLMHFPSVGTMRSLNNLQKILVGYCPLLTERCTPDSGPEWHKIEHVPEISIDGIIISKLKKQ